MSVDSNLILHYHKHNKLDYLIKYLSSPEAELIEVINNIITNGKDLKTVRSLLGNLQGACDNIIYNDFGDDTNFIHPVTHEIQRAHMLLRTKEILAK